MPFLLLVVFTIACLPESWPAPPAWLGAGGSALLTWMGVGALGLVAGLKVRRFRSRLLLCPDERSTILRRYRSWRHYLMYGLLAFYLAALYLFGWVTTVRHLSIFGMENPPGVELIILAPLVAGLVLTWALFYNVERAARPADASFYRSRWAYVAAQAQMNLILVCPPLLLVLFQQSVRRLFPGVTQEWVFPLLSLSMILAVLLGIPWILRLLLGLKPLPAGPLRDRLQAAARRLGLRFSDILLWNTSNGIANAMVTGLLPQLRYVVVTDRLIQDLTPEEIEAVFGHEVGHVRHYHLLYYFGFLILSLVVVVGLWEASPLPDLLDGLQVEKAVVPLPLFTMLGAYIFVVFGFLSRRCERQADVFGCRAVSCDRAGCSGHEDAVLAPRGTALCPTGIDTFISALEKVGRLNGIHRERPGLLSSWQHGSIARRVEFLEEVRRQPALEPRFQRRVGLVKWGLLLGLGALVGLMVLLAGPGRVWDLLSDQDTPPAKEQQPVRPGPGERLQTLTGQAGRSYLRWETVTPARSASEGTPPRSRFGLVSNPSPASINLSARRP